MENEIIEKEVEQEEVKQPTQKAKKEKATSERKKPSLSVSQILNGEFLTREFVLNNLNFIFFIILLLILIVAKGYYGKQLNDNVNKSQKELDEITAEYVEAKAKLEEVTRRQILVEQLEARGLKETVNPTKVIRIREKKEK
ncbi:MAG TPA: FtsL-like putative cell division protein [Taishania sp.]|nr:FtsL-like putative cell division protein [Taishania sp.]HNS41553.1 FtsL-like putative cell division protein [Taishania sp.]